MAERVPFSVSVESAAGRPATQGQIEVLRWSPSERARRAMRLGGICLALALGSVLIPIAHFVLVPGFLLACPALAAWVYQQTSQIRGGAALCPDCRAPLAIASGPERFPIHDVCSHCRAGVRIVLKPSPSEPV